MKYTLLLAVIFALALGSSAARVEERNIHDTEVKATPDNVPGVTIDGSRASAKQGYLFAVESRNSISVIKTSGKGARRQVGTLVCVSADSSKCYAFLLSSRTEARCKDTDRCHFEGILGGVRANL